MIDYTLFPTESCYKRIKIEVGLEPKANVILVLDQVMFYNALRQLEQVLNVQALELKGTEAPLYLSIGACILDAPTTPKVVHEVISSLSCTPDEIPDLESDITYDEIRIDYTFGETGVRLFLHGPAYKEQNLIEKLKNAISQYDNPTLLYDQNSNSVIFKETIGGLVTLVNDELQKRQKQPLNRGEAKRRARSFLKVLGYQQIQVGPNFQKKLVHFLKE